ncbi:hypothetical protein [Paraburkholderia sacchari]|uniref:hypothetical protein n=1 Tax=Paraburkholderia sacchari TaxID=159450 RepID=UPI0039A73862
MLDLDYYQEESMRAIRFMTAAVVVIVSLTQFGCGKHDGNEFVGTWKRVSQNGWFEVNIARNGDGDDFYVSHKVPNLGADGEADKWKIVREPAVAQDGKMVVSGGVPYVITIDKATGRLVVPGAEFERSK